MASSLLVFIHRCAHHNYCTLWLVNESHHDCIWVKLFKLK